MTTERTSRPRGEAPKERPSPKAGRVGVAGWLGLSALLAGAAASCGGDEAPPSDLDDGAAAPEQAAGEGALREPGGDALAEGDAPEVAPFDWVGIVGTGQSLSIGSTASAVISTTQPYENGMLVDDGPHPKFPLEGGAPVFSIAPLVEPVRPPLVGPGYSDRVYPDNVRGETPSSGMANQVTSLFLARTGKGYVTVHSVVGRSGRRLSAIDKDGGELPYRATLMEARAFRDLAAKAGKTFGYGAVVLTHGEADARNAEYGAGIKKLIDDHNADLKAITGQTRDIVLLASQQSTRVYVPGSATDLWLASLAHPNLIVCTGPKYQYAYSADRLHMPAASYRRLGEKYGEVYDIVVNQRKAWRPLQPRAATRSGTKIVVAFDVPVPPLQWDETLAPNHQTVNREWANGRGFEVTNAAGTKLRIASAAITGPSEVTLTLAAAPTGPVTVGYALTQDGTEENGGSVDGFRGQLRDSDELVGYDEETISVRVTNGSTTVNLTEGSTLARRGVRDVVTGEGAPKDWTVMAIASPTRMTMSAPWPGPTGARTLKVHHDLHNYAVHAFVTAP